MKITVHIAELSKNYANLSGVQITNGDPVKGQPTTVIKIGEFSTILPTNELLAALSALKREVAA